MTPEEYDELCGHFLREAALLRAFAVQVLVYNILRGVIQALSWDGALTDVRLLNGRLYAAAILVAVDMLDDGDVDLNAAIAEVVSAAHTLQRKDAAWKTVTTISAREVA